MRLDSISRRADLIRRFALAALFAASLDANAGLFSDDEAHKKIAAQQIEIDNLKATLSALEARVAKIESNTANIDLANQIQQLGVDMGKLRGQIEELNYANDQAQKRQKDFYVDLDTRLRKLEPAASDSAIPAPAGASMPAAADHAATPATPAAPAGAKIDLGSENREYEAAFNLFKIGNYSGAIGAFRDFIKSHPDSSMAASAQYWIGNSHFALRDFKNAIASQRQLVSAYPDSAKVPDALLNIASSQFELNDAAAAKKTLESIVAKYPQSESAQKARRRLQK